MLESMTYHQWTRLRGYSRPGADYQSVMRAYARRHGLASCLFPNGSVVVITRTPEGKLSQRSYKPGKAPVPLIGDSK